jgi:2-C-methyl-D-erythritol 4-phosphate cytidylyltransferase
VRYWLVMPAAGSSRRFGEGNLKQYAPLHGRTVIEWALAPFISDARCLGIAVALAGTDTYWPQIAARLPAVTVAAGGGERCESVRNALAVLSRRAAPDAWVLVHDAARPCLDSKDRDRLIERGSTHACGGLLAIPATDTLKQADSDHQVEGTLDRTVLWRAQTPQMFRYAKLCAALDAALNARRFPTDEAQALEWLGERPLLVEGSPGNLKITSAEDLKLAGALLVKAQTR